MGARSCIGKTLMHVNALADKPLPFKFPQQVLYDIKPPEGRKKAFEGALTKIGDARKELGSAQFGVKLTPGQQANDRLTAARAALGQANENARTLLKEWGEHEQIIDKYADLLSSIATNDPSPDHERSKRSTTTP